MRVAVRQLAEGRRRPVLVLDFLPFSELRPLGNVLAEHHDDHPVFRADPIGDLTATTGYHSVADLADCYAKACVEEAALAASEPLVVGFCSTALLAVRLAERIGGPPRVLLMQPSWPTEEQAWSDFASFRAQWAPGVPATDRGAVVSGPGPHPTPEELLARMTTVLENEVPPAAAAQGLDTVDGQELVRQMLDRYRAWLTYLLACAHELRAMSAPTLTLRLLAGADDQLTLPWPQREAMRVVRVPAPGERLLDNADQLAAAVLAEADR